MPDDLRCGPAHQPAGLGVEQQVAAGQVFGVDRIGGALGHRLHQRQTAALFTLQGLLVSQPLQHAPVAPLQCTGQGDHHGHDRCADDPDRVMPPGRHDLAAVDLGHQRPVSARYRMHHTQHLRAAKVQTGQRLAKRQLAAQGPGGQRIGAGQGHRGGAAQPADPVARAVDQPRDRTAARHRPGLQVRYQKILQIGAQHDSPGGRATRLRHWRHHIKPGAVAAQGGIVSRVEAGVLDKAGGDGQPGCGAQGSRERRRNASITRQQLGPGIEHQHRSIAIGRVQLAGAVEQLRQCGAITGLSAAGPVGQLRVAAHPLGLPQMLVQPALQLLGLQLGDGLQLAALVIQVVAVVQQQGQIAEQRDHCDRDQQRAQGQRGARRHRRRVGLGRRAGQPAGQRGVAQAGAQGHVCSPATLTQTCPDPTSGRGEPAQVPSAARLLACLRSRFAQRTSLGAVAVMTTLNPGLYRRHSASNAASDR